MTAVAVTAVGLGVNTKHACNVGALDKKAIEPLLSKIVEFILEDSATDSDSVIAFLSNNSVKHFGEPPDS